MHLLSAIYTNIAEITPLPMPSNGPDNDWVTGLFCGLLVLLTLIIVNGRRKFSFIIRSLYSARSRSQLLRESKPMSEWIYVFLLLYVFLTQGTLLYLLADHFLPTLAGHFAPALLWLACCGAFTLDYFLKKLNTLFLSTIFECRDDNGLLQQNRFFHLICSSLMLLPLLMVAFYTRHLSVLFLYIPLYLANFVFLLVKTLSLKSQQLGLFQFFLYFCTLEILPLLIAVKLLFFFDNQGF
jgi:hypothetical protein